MSKNKPEVVAGSISDYKPTVYIDLEGKELKEIEGLKLGKPITVVLKGKLVGITKRADTEGSRGSVQLEAPDVRISDGTEFDDMADD